MAVRQIEGYRFDPEGEYVRRWLPELARLPNEWIHHPWDAPPSALRAAGIELGTNYPCPIVDIGAAREQLQASLAEMWEREASMKAALANGLEEGLGETIEVPGTGGPLHEVMDVHRVVVRERAMSSNSSRRDQLVPDMPTEYHLQAHASIMHQSTYMIEDDEEAVAAVPPTTSHAVGLCVNNPASPVELNRGQGRVDRSRVGWPTVIAVDYDLDSTAESASVAGREDSGSGTVPVWSQSTTAWMEPLTATEGLVPVVPEVRRGGMPWRHFHTSVQRVNLEAMTNKVRLPCREDFYLFHQVHILN